MSTVLAAISVWALTPTLVFVLLCSAIYAREFVRGFLRTPPAEHVYDQEPFMVTVPIAPLTVPDYYRVSVSAPAETVGAERGFVDRQSNGDMTVTVGGPDRYEVGDVIRLHDGTTATVTSVHSTWGGHQLTTDTRTEVVSTYGLNEWTAEGALR